MYRLGGGGNGGGVRVSGGWAARGAMPNLVLTGVGG